jgi:hypothetical protein
MNKDIILSHIRDYIIKKKIKYSKTGIGIHKAFHFDCPFCGAKNGAHLPALNNFIDCHNCNPKKKLGRTYDLIDLARKIENLTGDEDDILHHLKELLKINVITKKDEERIESYLDLFEKNGFDLVPIKKDDKIPIEKDWTNKNHKIKKEWRQWIVDGINIGVKTGAISNVTIIDIDQKPIPEEVKKVMGETLMQESTKGFHLIYKYDKDFPKTRIDDLKIDIENDGGQVVIAPSIVKGVPRKIIKLLPVAQIPKELKEYLLTKITTPKKTLSETIREDIKSEDFKIDPKAFLLKNEGLEGCCNSEFIKLGGILRKHLNVRQTGYVLHTLNKHLLERPMESKAITAMVRELDKYTVFDEQELANKILEYLKIVDEATRTEIANAIVGTNRGEEKKRVDKALQYLVKEEKIVKKGSRYCVINAIDWKVELLEEGKPIPFKVPYFHDVAHFNWGDLILVGSKNKKGKTHISMNIVKKLVEQKIYPYYISLETGSRFKKIALQLGLKEGDIKHTFEVDPSKLTFPKDSVIIIDWLLIENKAETDMIFKRLVEQLYKTNSLLIVFMQLKQNNEWFAPNMVSQFPALSARYTYDTDSSGEFGKFQVDVIREPKMKVKTYEIPCQYNWETKELKRIEDIEKEKTDETDDNNT